MRSIARSMIRRGIAFIASTFTLVFLAAAPASAGVGGAAGPTWPATLVVGNPVSAFIDIINASDGVNA